MRTILMPALRRRRARACAPPARRTAAAAPARPRPRASRWRSTVASSPRATGPVSARSGPSAAQFSTVLRTSGASSARASPGTRSGPGGHLLGGGLERHEEVGGDRGSGVVGGAVARRRARTGACRAARPAPRAARDARRPWSPRRRSRLPRSRPAARRRRRSGAGEARRRSAPARSAGSSAASGVAPLVCPIRGAPPATAAAAAAISASGTQSRIASPRGSSPATRGTVDRDARLGERRRESRAEAAGSDDAHAARAGALVCVLEAMLLRVHSRRPSSGPVCREGYR